MTRGNALVVALGTLLAIALLFQVAKKAEQGRQALVKWTPQLEALMSGEDVYARSDTGGVRSDGDFAEGEGFPGTPTVGLVLAPFARLGAVPGSVAFGLLKLLCAALLLVVALRLAFEPREVPWLAALVLLVVCARVFASDLAHGNTNLLVAGAIAAALLAQARRMEAMSGFWIALAAALKLTPVLLLLYFVVRRSGAGLIGFAAGALFFVVAVPGAVFGFGHAFELLGSFGEQMIVPYAEGRALTLLQTEHTNQSLLGIAARWLTDSTAIAARPGTWESDVSIAFVHLPEAWFHWLHRVAALGVVVVCGFALARPRARADALGAFAIVGLAMLALSERSWKQHYVVIALPLAFLLGEAWRSKGTRRAIAISGLAASALLFGCTGSGVLGERGSDLAEAYGAFGLGAALLWCACVALYRWPEPEPVDSR